MISYQVYKFQGNPLDVRFLTRMSDGAARWTLTRGDANHYAKAEAEAVAAHYRKVFIGHTVGTVGSNKEYRAKNPAVKSNPIPKGARDLALKHRVNLGRDQHGNYYVTHEGKRVMTTAEKSPSVANAKALVRRYLRHYRKNPRGKKARAKNPVRGLFQLATLILGTQVGFYNGRGFNTDRREAAGFMSQEGAQKLALNLHWDAPIAVVNSTVTPQKIRAHLAGKGQGRRGNPVGPTRSEVEQAREKFSEFTGHAATRGRKVRLRVPKVAHEIGTLDGVMYTTVRDGRTEKYIHKFRQRSRPLLASAHDGKSLHILGGEYEFTERGIEDR